MKIRKNISINVEGETVFLSLFPPLVFRISRITNEYISAIDQNKENEFWDKLEQNFTIQEIKDFKSRFTYSGAYPFTFRQPIKHKIAFKSTILYPFIP